MRSYHFMAIKDYQNALVTGASSGIGEATVEMLCKQGIRVSTDPTTAKDEASSAGADTEGAFAILT
jgi:NAD(P)-dependent dehydrogenase (short-subunit alcohol dehydrogenase family)